MRKLVITSLFLAFSLSQLPHLQAGEVANIAVLAHDATIPRLQTYYAETDFHANVKAGKPTVEFSSYHWRTSAGEHLRESRRGRTVDASYDANHLELFSLDDAKRGIGPANLKIVNRYYYFTDANPWQLSLFALPTPATLNRQPIPIHSLKDVHQSYDLVSEKTVAKPNGELVQLHYRSVPEAREYQVTLDKNLSWLIVACRLSVDTRSDLGIFTYDATASEFIELKPGFHVPARASVRSSSVKTPPITHEAVLKGIKLNDTSIHLPRVEVPREGVLVFDDTQGLTYRMNSARQRVGKISKVGAPLDAPIATEGKPKADEDNKRRNILLLIASGAVGLIVGRLVWSQASRRGRVTVA